SAGNRKPIRSVPILNIECSYSILAKSHVLGRLRRTAKVILDGEDIDLVNAFSPVDVDLGRVGINARGTVVPSASASPVHTSTVPIVHSCYRKRAVILRRRGRNATICRCCNIRSFRRCWVGGCRCTTSPGFNFNYSAVARQRS